MIQRKLPSPQASPLADNNSYAAPRKNSADFYRGDTYLSYRQTEQPPSMTLKKVIDWFRPSDPQNTVRYFTQNAIKFDEAKTVMRQAIALEQAILHESLSIPDNCADPSTIAAHQISELHRKLGSSAGFIMLDVSGLFIDDPSFKSPWPGYGFKAFAQGPGIEAFAQIFAGKRCRIVGAYALTNDGSTIFLSTGSMAGHIVSPPRFGTSVDGINSFGWDSIVVPEGKTLTLAEMHDQRISQGHRRFCLYEVVSYVRNAYYICDPDPRTGLPQTDYNFYELHITVSELDRADGEPPQHYFARMREYSHEFQKVCKENLKQQNGILIYNVHPDPDAANRVYLVPHMQTKQFYTFPNPGEAALLAVELGAQLSTFGFRPIRHRVEGLATHPLAPHSEEAAAAANARDYFEFHCSLWMNEAKDSDMIPRADFPKVLALAAEFGPSVFVSVRDNFIYLNMRQSKVTSEVAYQHRDRLIAAIKENGWYPFESKPEYLFHDDDYERDYPTPSLLREHYLSVPISDVHALLSGAL